MELTFVQQFGEGCRMVRCGRCNQPDCINSAVATWQDKDHNAFHLCEKHRTALNAPPVTPGVEYAPTMALMNGWAMRNGVPVRVG